MTGLNPDVIPCARIVQDGDSERFAAVMAADVSRRNILFPLYAFNVEVSRAPWVTEEAMIAEMRLQWWRDVLDEIRGGTPVRSHEVSSALTGVLDPPACDVLDHVIEARRWDIYKDPFEDAAAFKAHIEATAGGLLWTAVRLTGEGDETTVRNAGYAMGVANWLRAIPAFEASGRVPLVDGRPEAVQALASEALDCLKQARVTRFSNPTMLAVWQAGSILSQAIRDPRSVGDGRLGLSLFRSKTSLAIRAFSGRW